MPRQFCVLFMLRMCAISRLTSGRLKCTKINSTLKIEYKATRAEKALRGV